MTFQHINLNNFDMKTLFILFMILIFSFLILISKAQQHTLKMKFNIGIPIDQKSFDNLTKKELAILKGNENICTQDILNIIRIDNTIKMQELTGLKPIYNKLDSSLGKKFVLLLINKLNAEFSKGGAFYIRRYSIFWGGTPDSNSMFKIK